jgi:hypothetical protein
VDVGRRRRRWSGCRPGRAGRRRSHRCASVIDAVFHRPAQVADGGGHRRMGGVDDPVPSARGRVLMGAAVESVSGGGTRFGVRSRVGWRGLKVVGLHRSGGANACTMETCSSRSVGIFGR